MVIEPDPLPELLRSLTADYEPIPIHLRSERDQFIEHEPADPLFAEISRNYKIANDERIGCDVYREHGNEVTDELAEEAGRGCR